MLRCQVCLVALSKTLMQQQYSFSQKYVRVRMRRFFDGQQVSETSGRSTEDICERAIPWASIEFAQIIEDPINFEVPAIWGSCGKIVLDNKHKTFITSTHDHGE